MTCPSPERITLWLEDVPDDTPEVWSLERHVLTAGHLGAFNAAHPVGEETPPWLWQGWLPSMNPGLAQASAPPGNVWDELLVRTAFPVSCTGLLERMEGAFEGWSGLLTALPRTLVHLDAGRFNVRALWERGRETSVLVDWQALGVGPLGTDLAMAHFLNLCRFYADPREAALLDAGGFEAYWQAVKAGNLSVDQPEVRFTYAAVCALRAASVVRLLIPRLVTPNVDLRLWEQWGRRRGWADEEALRAWGQGMTFLLALGGEADGLARNL